jgi:hypothetical protein
MRNGREFVIKNRVKISLLILLLGFGFSFAAMNYKLTGMTVGNGDVEQNIVRSQESMNFLMQERETCFNDLNSARASYNGCQLDLVKEGNLFDECTAAKDIIETNYTVCQLSRDLLETQLTKKISDFDMLAKNSVTSICCSFSDFKAGTIKNWGIVDNNIQCTGDFKVNCTTGEAG